MGYAGFTVVVCQTARGRLEFAVPNPDVPLVLHYVRRGIGEHARGPDTGQTSQSAG
ncbi:MAG: hypothetical protein WBH47_07025 [Streptosporangiaceae bacterium]